MATYYHGNSELQGGNDGLQTLILMNPGYTGYSDGQPSQQGGNNLVFFNSNNSGNPLNLPHTPPPMQAQRFLGVPLPGSHTGQSSQDQNDISALQGFVQRGQYNFYSPTIDFTAGRETPRTQQGLSLSLSPQQTAYGAFRLEREGPSQQAMVTTTVSPTNGGSGGSSSSASGVSNSVNGMRNVLLNHKYLKAAQELLDEVVNVGKEVKNGVESSKNKNIGESSMAPSGVVGDGQSGRDTGGGKRSAELSTAERQEIQMKKAKLVNMLDEVEQRYRQYHQQMQIVITWFEQAAGIGAAKTYTALALQTISKQFRCLKDAILGQIRAASKSLGEEDSFGGKMEGSRLKFVDNQLRQQRALQQLGMIQHNAWRPQRGLPERSVSVLRAWLFEHFLHPYPKDSDKIMLAKQTGLTRSQVSNWFINARVRLWKPMVEEMYTEEMKEQEKNASEENTNSKNEDSTSKAANSSQDKSPGIENQIKSFMSKQEIISTTSPSPTGIEIQNHSGFNLIASSDMESISQGSPKKLMLMNGNEKPSRDGFALMGAPTNFIGGFGSYSMGELGRFDGDPFPGSYSGNGVSLTLGLPHCENLSMPGNYQTFLPNQLGRGDEMEENDVYESINIQNRKRFAAPLLPDFVS